MEFVSVGADSPVRIAVAMNLGPLTFLFMDVAVLTGEARTVD